MLEHEFDRELSRLASVVPPTKEPEEIVRRTSLRAELWRKFFSLSVDRWREIVTYVLEHHDDTFRGPLFWAFDIAKRTSAPKDDLPPPAVSPKEHAGIIASLDGIHTRAGAEAALDYAERLNWNIPDHLRAKLRHIASHGERGFDFHDGERPIEQNLMHSVLAREAKRFFGYSDDSSLTQEETSKVREYVWTRYKQLKASTAAKPKSIGSLLAQPRSP